MNIALKELVKRNTKLYFKDKSTFLTSMISPMILLVLFLTFLGSVYKQSLLSILPESCPISDSLVDSFTISWLMSSILGVSCVTVAFCANVIMPQDKVSGAVHDILVAPINKSTLAISYFIGNFITTLIVCLIVACLGFVYLSTIGWYISVADLLLIICDIVLTVLFGSALASLVENFISSPNGISAVVSLVSALYGFLCGAYMPISQFSEGIRNLISVLPGTYTMGLLRNHYMNGVLDEMSNTVPNQAITAIRNGFDANLYIDGTNVEMWQMYSIVGGCTLVFIALYVLINRAQGKKNK